MGSCGVLPSLVYHFYHDQNYPKKTIIQGLKVAGLIGNLIHITLLHQEKLQNDFIIIQVLVHFINQKIFIL